MWIWNRTPARAERLAEEFGAIEVAADGESPAAGDYDLIVNATAVGMGHSAARPGGFKSLPIAADALAKTHELVDLAYGPVETELARQARTRGVTVVDGLEVLVRQGAASLRIWTGMEPPLEAMRRAAREG